MYSAPARGHVGPGSTHMRDVAVHRIVTITSVSLIVCLVISCCCVKNNFLFQLLHRRILEPNVVVYKQDDKNCKVRVRIRNNNKQWHWRCLWIQTVENTRRSKVNSNQRYLQSKMLNMQIVKNNCETLAIRRETGTYYVIFQIFAVQIFTLRDWNWLPRIRLFSNFAL